MSRAEDFVERFTRWVEKRGDVLAAALVGSRARGDARPDSDVDLVIVTRARRSYVTNQEWVHELGSVKSIAVERWGAVTSLRVRYEQWPEVEFAVASPAWAQTDPVDAGTAWVISEGFRILLDRESLLDDLLTAFEKMGVTTRK
ncbi:MAG: nucleotidyltransferase domain-containing protein [Actinomycetota bacterium]|nr:nucleotidyltransferase domain-containing protein [Actinomycetota bacterium]